MPKCRIRYRVTKRMVSLFRIKKLLCFRCFLETLGFGWYDCTCCPYGYHIDLDFVRYCESIERHSERTGSIKRRRDRRRQRQSMDMLLGLVPPLLLNVEQNHNKVIAVHKHYMRLLFVVSKKTF